MSADASPNPIEIRTHFVRGRNALAARGLFTELYVDHYLHLMQHGIRLESGPDQILKDALAAMTLHLASRPWNETSAWTVNLQEPLLNLFVTGSSLGENVIGRVFLDDVRRAEKNLFHSQVTSPRHPLRQSVVEIEGPDLFAAVETYYRMSEQRPARLFRLAEEEFAMLSAQPGCDLAWFEALDTGAVARLDQEEELSLLEQRRYAYDCGCTIERVYPLLAPLSAALLDDLFAGDPQVEVTCPRCGARFTVRRADLDAFLERR